MAVLLSLRLLPLGQEGGARRKIRTDDVVPFLYKGGEEIERPEGEEELDGRSPRRNYQLYIPLLLSLYFVKYILSGEFNQLCCCSINNYPLRVDGWCGRGGRQKEGTSFGR